MANFRQIRGVSWDLLHVPPVSAQHLHGPQWLLREWVEVLTGWWVTQVKQLEPITDFNWGESHSHGGTQKLDGLFHGQSQSKMDD